jgi:hypothetical protein
MRQQQMQDELRVMNQAVKLKPAYQPKIFRQGLQLIFIPLVVGTCILLLLLRLCQEIQDSAIDEQKQGQAWFTTVLLSICAALPRLI